MRRFDTTSSLARSWSKALAYHWDHVSELDEDTESRCRLADDSRRESASSPLTQRLAALKHRW